MICFDTNPVIWGVQGVPDAAQPDLVPRTQAFLATLAAAGTRVLIPAPVLAEYLVGFSDADMQGQAVAVGKRFFVAPFDVRAALVAAELGRDALSRVRQAGHNVSKQQVKVDVQVVAIAIVHGCTEIVSHDPHLGTIANGKIVVRSVPLAAPPVPTGSPAPAPAPAPAPTLSPVPTPPATMPASVVAKPNTPPTT